MTLIMTHVSQRRIFQSGDFRLTDSRTGKDLDYWAQKQIIVQRSRWTALVGFCGIAHTGRQYVPEWVVQQLRGTPHDAPFEDFLTRLQSAEDWLTNAIPKFRAITFSVGAFVDFRPTFVLVSNFEAIGRPPRPLQRSLPTTLEVTRFRPKKEQLFLSGRPDAVLAEERQRLRGIFRKLSSPDRGYAALAEINRCASTRDGTVGPTCFTAHVTALGDHGGTVHDWPADRDYLPVFVDVHGTFLPRLKPQLDEHGRPKPIQIVGMSGTMFEPSAEYFQLALEEKPTDPSVLSNYGNWLKDRGELDEAQASYTEAIASDDAFASAHGNLAILLDERGDVDAAEEEYRRAVDLDSNSPIWAANLAFFLWHLRGERAAGETLLKEALERQRDAFTLGRHARFTDLALGDQDTARRLYEEALGIAPEDAWTNGRFADFLRRAGELGAARAHFERAVEGREPDHDALLAYAELQVRGGSLESAVELLRRALKLRPRNPNALAMLAATRTLLGAADGEVERMYRQALEWDPGHAVAALNLSQLLLRRGAGDEAQRWLFAADQADLVPELRLELLFYGVAYCLAGFGDAPAEIRSLLDAGARLSAWDLSREVAAAKERGHPHAELLAQVAGGSHMAGR